MRTAARLTVVRQSGFTPVCAYQKGAVVTANSKCGAATPLGELLAGQRIEKGLSQGDLVAKLHTLSGNDSITREDISRWERGKRIPGPYWRQWLSGVLDTSGQELELAAAVARRQRRKTHRGGGGQLPAEEKVPKKWPLPGGTPILG